MALLNRIKPVLALTCLTNILAFSSAYAAPAHQPTNEEIALLVLANQARSNPHFYGSGDSAQPPMIWNSDLADAAYEHSDDMATNACFGHDSCNGGSWDARVSRHYKNWRYIGENVIGMATDPRDMHTGWMGSAGHRANILDGVFSEFGGGIEEGVDGFGAVTYATENFGSRGMKALNSLPTLIAGTVLPRSGSSSEERELLVNYFHYSGGRPQAVRAIVGNRCIPLEVTADAPAQTATYGIKRNLTGSGCVPMIFEAVRNDGVVARYPSTGSILVGIGSANCAYLSDSVPSADCGAGNATPGKGGTDGDGDGDGDGETQPADSSLTPVLTPTLSDNLLKEKLQVTVKLNGNVVNRLKVTVKITKPDGTPLSKKPITIVTNKKGIATLNKAFSRKKGAGTYSVLVETADVSLRNALTSASLDIVVPAYVPKPKK